MKVPEKIRFFLWLVAHGALPTNVKRFHSHLAASAACPRCDADHEDLDHLVRWCPDSQSLWSKFRHVLPSLAVTTYFNTWFANVLAHRNNILGVTIMWWAWRWRNSRVFEPQAPSLNQILRCVLRDESLWRESWKQPLHNTPTSDHVMVSHTQPTPCISVDGSWNPQFGRMGCAAVVRDGHGRWVTGISQSFHQGGPFLAEILALELCLLHAKDSGIKKVVCWSDCATLVNLLQTGSDAASYWNLEDIQRVRQLMTTFEEINLVTIERDKNNTADALAREACRTGTPFQRWNDPPLLFMHHCI